MKRRALILAAVAFGTASAPALAAKSLGPGSRGSAVKSVQAKLGLPADGIYGRATVRAVRRFQRRHALPVTGRVDVTTRRAINGPPSTGGATPPDAPSAPAAPTSDTSFVDAVRSAVGKPYKTGGSGPDAFDCSGLVVWAAAAAGVDLPRSSFAQYKLGTAVDKTDLAAGDLVFFDTNGPGASDVGVAISSDTAISATTHGVREHPILGPYWGDHYVGARRL